jgi:hypothetical protein
MNKKELHNEFYMYGNKGACWTNNIHIAKSGSSTTLCGTPMLAFNWANRWEKEEIECEDCLLKYNEEPIVKATKDGKISR